LYISKDPLFNTVAGNNNKVIINQLYNNGLQLQQQASWLSLKEKVLVYSSGVIDSRSPELLETEEQQAQIEEQD
jgi:hypothetical protein